MNPGSFFSCSLPFAITWVDLKDIILNEMLEKDKYHLISLIDGILKTTENIGDHWQWRVGEMNEGYQKVQASCYKINKPWGYSMCSMVTVVNSTGLYIWQLLREWILNSVIVRKIFVVTFFMLIRFMWCSFFSITYIESLHCIPENSIMLHVNYFSVKV